MFIKFTMPKLQGKEAIVAPASGKTRRYVTAVCVDTLGNEISNTDITYQLQEEIDGIWLQDDILYVSSSITQSITVAVIAFASKHPEISATEYVEIIKQPNLCDTPPSPLEKPGYRLVYNESFENNCLDRRKWCEYYLRGWTTDELSKADYFFDNNQLIITANKGRKPWCKQDGKHRVSGLQTFERQHLHRFGKVTGARNISDFNGYATKYGYFEIRLRMPDTKDGSHFAWWMIGVQDDQHVSATLHNTELYPHGEYSNQTAEFDIIEQTIDEYRKNPDYDTHIWRPVIHPNGSDDLSYLWVEPTPIINSATNEFHTYGFEWDETGTKFYLDGKVVKETDRTPNYRMMTLLTLYSGAPEGSIGMGTDRGIYPKDAIIDYFRVYKKEEPAKPTSIVINHYHSPSYLYVPKSGSNQYQMQAHAIDQFDEPIDATIKWKLSSDIKGRNISDKVVSINGVTINSDTGMITVQSDANLDTDLFVTAYINDTIREVKHIKLSNSLPQPETIRFNKTVDTIQKGNSICMKANVYDQYGNILEAPIEYCITSDITGNTTKEVEGVTITSDGMLTVSNNANSESYLFITALYKEHQDLCKTHVLLIH